MFTHLRGWTRIVMGIAILTVELISSSAHAQPRRPGRTAQLAAQQVPATNCNADDADVARTHRRAGIAAFEAHDWRTCISEYTVAVARCATPEARFNLGYCMENQGQLAEALAEYEQLQRDNTLPPGITSELLERTIASVRARVPRTAVTPVVVHPVAVTCTANLQTDLNNCGTCGHACTTNQTCNAGTCRVQQIVTPPITTPPRSNLASTALIIAGSVVAATGGVLLGIGIAANNDAGNLCETTTNTPRCLVVINGDPRDYTSLTTVGGVTMGVGAAAAITGVLLRILNPGTTGTQRSVAFIPTPNGFAVTGRF